LLTGGATVPRGLPIKGSTLKGVHYAMDFLKQNNQRVAGDEFSEAETLWAGGKNIVVIGGGDTGSDCVGTSNRHGANSITQLELLAKPPEGRAEQTPWPLWPLTLRTSSSHEEGCDRTWAVLTKAFLGDENGQVRALQVVNVEWAIPTDGDRPSFVEVPGTLREIPCDLALLAIGFVHPQHKGLLEQLGVELDKRGNVATENYQTSVPKVFAAGDMRRGQSLVVWAIAEGREAAEAVDMFLKKEG
ncbi:MAG: FAD-dependent oxidoreductase, partial [Chitinophagales bacterium]